MAEDASFGNVNADPASQGIQGNDTTAYEEHSQNPVGSPTGLEVSRQSEQEADSRYLNIFNIIKLGIGFFLVFAAFLSQQNLAPRLLRELGYGNLGFISIAVLYSVFIVACSIAPAVLQFIDDRKALVAATICYALFCCSGLLPATCAQSTAECSDEIIVSIVLLAAVVIGMSAAFVWIPQGAILTYNSPQYLVNTYASLFQVLLQAAQPAGAALSSLLIDKPVNFFIGLTGVSLLGTLVLSTIRQPKPHPSIPKPSLVRNTISFRTILLPQLDLLCHDRRGHLVAVWGALMGLFRNGGPGCLVPMFARSMTEAAQMLVALGCGNMSGAFIFGRLADRLGRRLCLLLASVVELTALLLFWVSSCGSSETCTVEVSFLVAFILGCGNSLSFCNLSACITASLHDKARAGFGTMQMFISVTSIPTFLIIPQISPEVGLLVFAIALIIFTAHLGFHPIIFLTLLVEESQTNECIEAVGASSISAMSSAHKGFAAEAESSELTSGKSVCR